MAKRGETKRIDIVHHSVKKSTKSSSPKEIEKKLVENLIELQKVHTHLAEKFDKLSDQISNLLTLFEMTAKSFSTQPGVQASEKDKEFLEKIDRLLDQNKTIAKGLTLMEERIRERVYGSSKPEETSSPPQQNTSGDEYHPSSSSQNRPLPRF